MRNCTKPRRAIIGELQKQPLLGIDGAAAEIAAIADHKRIHASSVRAMTVCSTVTGAANGDVYRQALNRPMDGTKPIPMDIGLGFE